MTAQNAESFRQLVTDIVTDARSFRSRQRRIQMENEIANRGEILLYGDDNGKEFINVVFKDETFWLTKKAWQNCLIAQRIIFPFT